MLQNVFASFLLYVYVCVCVQTFIYNIWTPSLPIQMVIYSGQKTHVIFSSNTATKPGRKKIKIYDHIYLDSHQLKNRNYEKNFTILIFR